MSVVVVRTNQLCANCLYLPAEDLESNQCQDRITAIECNDLCSDCVRNPKVRVINVEAGEACKQRVTANSLWLKKHTKDGKGVGSTTMAVTKDEEIIDPNPFKSNNFVSRAQFIRNNDSNKIDLAIKQAGLTGCLDHYAGP